MSEILEADYNPDDVGEIIKHIRESHAMLDQDKFAEYVGMKAETLKNIEDGKTVHGYKSLQNIAEKFGIELTITIKIP